MPAAPTTLKFSGGTLVLDEHRSSGVTEFGAGIEWIWDSRVRAWRCDALAYLIPLVHVRFLLRRRLLSQRIRFWKAGVDRPFDGKGVFLVSCIPEFLHSLSSPWNRSSAAAGAIGVLDGAQLAPAQVPTDGQNPT